MPVIELETIVQAPITEVFDLARSIDLHIEGAGKTREVAVAGTTSGLISANETVTWRATHFGILQELTSVISRMDRPLLFEDQMVKGAFKRLEHVHEFVECETGTRMKDTFLYEAPFGVLGRLAESTFLTSYLRRFLVAKNEHLKRVAESERKYRFLKTE